MTRVMVFPLLLLLSCRPAPRVEVAADDDADALFARALARIDDIDRGLPRVEDGFIWWGDRDDDGRTAHCRRGLVPGDAVEVVLDEHSEVVSDEGYVDVGVLAASPDGGSVAFSADVTRSDRYGVHVKNLKSGRIDKVVDDADFSVAWSKDGNLWFTRFGGDDRPRSLWRLQPDRDTAPTLVHELPSGDAGDLRVAGVDDRAELFVREADDGGVTAFRLGAPAVDHGGTLRAPPRPTRALVR
jgi:protease II